MNMQQWEKPMGESKPPAIPEISEERIRERARALWKLEGEQTDNLEMLTGIALSS